MNVNLKVEIVRKRLKAYEVAHRLNWAPSKLSAVINQGYLPTIEEKQHLADVLGVQVSEIFEEIPNYEI